MRIVIKTFEALTKQELYNLLRLRSEVFVVEQNCVYQDIDDKDYKALHVLGYKNDNLIGYTRLFKAGDYFNEASIGRVVVKKSERQARYGYLIMEESIQAIADYYKETTIKISAQKYLERFYNRVGFKKIGKEYLEDGIPHIAMIKKEV